MGWSADILQQIRDQVLGQVTTKFGDLKEEIYLQQIIKALLAQPQVGPYGNLDRRIYLQQIRDYLTAVLATYPKGQLLKTGQLTSYGSGTGVDDGALRKGIAKAYQILTTGQYAGTKAVTINSKTDNHSNNCVLDNNTGLMWSRYVSASIGPASDGKLPWTTTGSGATAEGIFAYVAAANAANLGGYNDWRIPNMFELVSLMDGEAPTGAPDSTAFPTWPTTAGLVWSSTTRPDSTTGAIVGNYTSGVTGVQVKTGTAFCALVRAGNP